MRYVTDRSIQIRKSRRGSGAHRGSELAHRGTFLSSIHSQRAQAGSAQPAKASLACRSSSSPETLTQACLQAGFLPARPFPLEPLPNPKGPGTLFSAAAAPRDPLPRSPPESPPAERTTRQATSLPASNLRGRAGGRGKANSYKILCYYIWLPHNVWENVIVLIEFDLLVRLIVPALIKRASLQLERKPPCRGGPPWDQQDPGSLLPPEAFSKYSA